MNIEYNNETVEVSGLSIDPGPRPVEHQLHGIAPVVQDQGKTVRLTSPISLAQGARFSWDSGVAGMRYTARVQTCMDNGSGGFSISGIIGD